MRMATPVASLLAVLVVAAAVEGGPRSPRRRDCLQVCAPLVAACSGVCGAFGVSDPSCRRAVLKRCHREGLAACSAVPTTVPRTPTTLRPTTTTTSTLPLPDTCAAARPLVIGQVEFGDTSFATAGDAGRACVANADTQDVVYTVVPPASGTLTLTLSSEWDSGVYVRTSCGDPLSELGCADAQGGGPDEVLSVAVTAGVTYWVFVDGYTADQYGPFSLTVALQ